MINVFREIFPRRVDADTTQFLTECLARLPSETYGIYIKQINEGLLKYKGFPDVDHGIFKNYINFTYESKISGKYQNWDGRFWRVRNISVDNYGKTQITNVSIFFDHGLVCGYAFEAGRNFDPDPKSVDVSNAIKEFLDSPDPVVKTLISDREQDLINWSDVYEVELEGSTYFHLRDVGDGDFIGMDGAGLFYEIHHDPFEIIGLEGSLKEILARCQVNKNSGQT